MVRRIRTSTFVKSGHPSLRSKLVRVMIGTLSLVTIVVIATVAVLHTRSSARSLDLMQAKIRESMIKKGEGLVNNHAIALRGLVEDNAFSDVRRLVESTLRADKDLAFGLFIDNQGQPWAYVSPNAPPGSNKPEAWRELQIDKPTLSGPPRISFQQRLLFGEQVFQFASSVRDGNGQRLGTLIYGSWTAPLDAALAAARADSRRSLQYWIGLLSALTVVSILSGWLLVRRAAALITRPLGTLTAATASLARGERTLRVNIQSRDEIEVLGDSFNTMVAQLDESYQRLEGLNRTLEYKVEERTRELAGRNRDLRLVLDNVNEGLLTISRSGLLAEERSAAIDRWFGRYVADEKFADFVGKLNPEFARMFSLGYEAVLEDILPLEVNLAQLPSRLQHDGRTYHLTYTPLLDGSTLNGLLITITDITEQLQRAQHEADQQELLAMFQGLMRDRPLFLSFFEEASSLVDRLATGHPLAEMKRAAHTLKGNASVASLNVVATLCHQLEDKLEERDEVGVADRLTALRARWKSLQLQLRQLLGDDASERVEVDPRDIEEVCADLQRHVPRQSIVARLASWRYTPVSQLFGRLGDQAQALARRLGRGELEVRIDDAGLRLDPRRWDPLWTEMVHLVRNAVDHGMESSEHRRAVGKPAVPQLRLRAHVREQNLVIEVEDDGRGIDWQAVARAAASRGLPHETQSELVAALFVEGLSSKAEVTTTSGRGIGMSAVNRQVKALAGSITVVSVPQRGTTWRMVFPAEGVAVDSHVEQASRRLSASGVPS